MRRYGVMSRRIVLPEVTFLPVIDDPQKINVCVRARITPISVLSFNMKPTRPQPFLSALRFLEPTLNGLLLKPENTNEFDYEGELAVIGGDAPRVSAEDALDCRRIQRCLYGWFSGDWQHSWFTAGKTGLRQDHSVRVW